MGGNPNVAGLTDVVEDLAGHACEERSASDVGVDGQAEDAWAGGREHVVQ
ncbi:hypothetical protein OG372_18180 [Streptomyces sp. NBC_01020]|nr:hypothetical protein OG372_18180 [Streptomyces sp. NBC_01020]